MSAREVARKICKKILQLCLDFFRKFLHFPAVASITIRHTENLKSNVSIRSILLDSKMTLSNCLILDPVCEGQDIGTVPSYLRPLIAHDAAIILTKLVVREGTFVWRDFQETMKKILKDKGRHFTLSQLIVKIITAESVHEFQPESIENSDDSLSKYRRKSEDRILFHDIVETLSYTDISKEKNRSSGTWTIPELRNMRIRKTAFLADYKNNPTSRFSCNEDNQCEKKIPKSATNLSGISVFSCGEKDCPCGNIVYAMIFNDQGESPKIFFNFIREKFKIPPLVIMYDNVCHLKSYCMARDPLFFRFCMFLFDRLHECNHK